MHFVHRCWTYTPSVKLWFLKLRPPGFNSLILLARPVEMTLIESCAGCTCSGQSILDLAQQCCFFATICSEDVWMVAKLLDYFDILQCDWYRLSVCDANIDPWDKSWICIDTSINLNLPSSKLVMAVATPDEVGTWYRICCSDTLHILYLSIMPSWIKLFGKTKDSVSDLY